MSALACGEGGRRATIPLFFLPHTCVAWLSTCIRILADNLSVLIDIGPPPAVRLTYQITPVSSRNASSCYYMRIREATSSEFIAQNA